MSWRQIENSNGSEAKEACSHPMKRARNDAWYESTRIVQIPNLRFHFSFDQLESSVCSQSLASDVVTIVVGMFEMMYA